MTKLRDKTHLVLYTLLAAFLALIVFEWGMNFNGITGGGVLAGKVNGRAVEYRQYQEVYDNLVENFRRNAPDAEITDQIELQLHDRAWNAVVDQLLLEEQLERFDITVSGEEILASVEGSDPPMIIRQNFTDPQTGELDRERFEQARMAPENREIWPQVEEIIRQELKVRKLEQMLSMSATVTEKELDELVAREFAVWNAGFLAVPYAAAGSQEMFAVTDSEIRSYYQEHREVFRQAPTRSLAYVVFPAAPTGRDSMSVKTELEALVPGFTETEDDSSFVSLQSDRSTTFDQRYTRADFSPDAAREVFGSGNLEAGKVIGPVADRGAYRLIKVNALEKGELAVRASHILFRVDASDPASRVQAEAKADEVRKKLSSGTSFAELARSYSDDPGSARNGGDLGWFAKGAMVAPFEEAAFAMSPGSVSEPVETPFGLHIIKVTGRDDRVLVGSEVVREIRPSGTTLESVRRTATEFLIDAEDNGFDEAAASRQLDIVETGHFTRTGMIPAIGFNNQVSRFAFEHSEGKLSDVLEVQGGFAVFNVTGKNTSGYRTLDDQLRQRIESILLQEKQGDALETELEALLAKHGNDLDAIAAEFDGASVERRNELQLNRENAVDPYLAEAMTGLEPGAVSRPVETSNGRGVVFLVSREWLEGSDIPEEREQLKPLLLQAKTQQLLQDFFEGIRQTADIEDMRKL
ncbi:MAG: peptidylprolyl isomerase [Prosthecochloris sp.]|nr:peptidylprolyl isomerase [Prosthecochloris sp.]